MHRYIPYLAKNAGFKKIGEKVVHHQARKYGKTKFGLNRFVNGYLDLLSLWFPFPVSASSPCTFSGIAGFADVHLRLHSRGHSGCQQVVLHAPWHALPPS